MKPAEKIARDTWERIKQSRDVKVRLGEGTFTDLLILDYLRLMRNRTTRLFQSTGKQESKRGCDLEIRIHKGGNRAIAFAVQAKKLNRSENYNALNYKVKSSNSFSFQIDILETYSQSVGAIPLYLLYNYVDREIIPYWHCCEPLDKSQLGCTLVPSWIIRQAIETWGCRNFDWIHRAKSGKYSALPWRCFLECPRKSDPPFLPPGKIGSMFSESVSFFNGEGIDRIFVGKNRNYDYGWVRFEPVDGGWPTWLWEKDDATLSDYEVNRLRGEIGEARVADFPTERLPSNLLLVEEEEVPEN